MYPWLKSKLDLKFSSKFTAQPCILPTFKVGRAAPMKSSGHLESDACNARHRHPERGTAEITKKRGERERDRGKESPDTALRS